MGAAVTTFEDFRRIIRCLDSSKSRSIRKRFIDEFVDLTQPNARESLRFQEFKDGRAYTGYLWDFLKGRALIDEKELWRRVGRRDWVYAMWDVHTSERIFIKHYWRFPKEAILVARPPALIRQGQSYLPEDLYLFDASFAWVAALTHDEIDRKRFCLWSGNPYPA